MLQIIASTYELIDKLGSGGGGSVYLARHLRLDKKVVLKKDKRKLRVSQDLLRREVDILKELSHPYIPRVYDFFVEGEEVYTVMDYIEGESLDKALKRGETFSQPQVIRWACQLLDALSYLHSPTHGDPPRGFVHSDIKPANLMRTIQGDIYLIDFNIALALGEENVIGCSPGYASPEHYGLDYSVEENTGNDRLEEEDTDITVTLQLSGTDSDLSDDSLTLTLAEAPINSTEASSGAQRINSTKASLGVQRINSTEASPGAQRINFSEALPGAAYRYDSSSVLPRKSFSGTSGKRVVNPDVRSDIYSVGATLYHLLEGNRPSKNAKEVVRLSDRKFSPQVVRIISKAMNLNPDRRYQTADEMREDFLNLRKRDPRVRRWKRQRILASVFFSVFFVAGGAASFIGLKRMQMTENWINLTEASQKAWNQGNVEAAVDGAREVIAVSSEQWRPEHVPGAQKVLTEALGVYDLSDGYKRYKTIELPSPPLYLAISPEGKNGAALCGQSVLIFDTDTAEVISELPVEKSALSEIKFSDSNTILYAGKGGIKAYDVEAGRELWTGAAAASIAISADGSCAAGIYEGDSFATVYDVRTGKVKCKIDFEGKQQNLAIGDNLFALNQDASWMGVSFRDGSIHMYDLVNQEKEIIIYNKGSEYTHFEGGFSGKYFAFSASDQEESKFVIIDLEKEAEKGGFQSESAFRVQTDESGIYVQSDHILVRIDPDTGEQIPLVTMEENILCFARCEHHTLAASENGIYFFNSEAQLISSCEEEGRNDLAGITEKMAVIGSMDKPVVRIMRNEEHSDSELFLYDPAYAHDEARVSSDEKTVMLFSYDQFRIYDKEGTLVQEVFLSEPEHVLNQQFIRDGEESCLKVTYDNGNISVYSARNGKLIEETNIGKISEKPEEKTNGKSNGEFSEKPEEKTDGESNGEFSEKPEEKTNGKSGEDSSEKPDEEPGRNIFGELDEEFFVGNLRIESPLHGTPVAYDAETGKEIARLKKDTYLTYVTQAGGYIVAQYITADGYCSGQLLNEKCEVLAELPYLCDVMGETLIFDYPTGTIRKSNIYSIEELMDMECN